MSTSGNNSNNSRHVIHLRLQNSGCPETVPTSIEITCQQEFGVRSGAAWETIRAEKGVLGKVRGAFTQAQGLRKEWSGTKYCTIKFTFRSSSEYSRNYQYIDDSGSGKSESLFQIEADNTSDLIQEIYFLKKNDDLVDVKFSDIDLFTYAVKSGYIDQLFNLGHK